MRPILLFLLFAFVQDAYCQTTIVISGDSARRYVRRESFRKVVANTFAQIASGQENASALTNYAAFEPAAGKFTLNGAAGLDNNNKHYFTFTASGSIENNVAKLFEDSKLNTSVNFNFKYHYRLPFTTFYYTSEQKVDLHDELNTIRIDSVLAVQKIKNDSVLGVRKIDLEKKRKNVLEQEITVLQGNVGTIERLGRLTKPDGQPVYNRDSLLLVRLTLQQKIAANQRDTGIINYRIDSFHTAIQSRVKLKDTLEKTQKQYKTLIEDKELGAPWNAFRLAWFTLRINPGRDKFYTYDSTDYFFSQVKKEIFTTFYAGIEGNIYYWTNKGQNTQYANLGIGYQRKNNLSDLETLDVSTEYEKKDSSGFYKRKFVAKYTTYDRDSVTHTNSLLAYGNYYWFFSKGGLAALHLFPEYEYSLDDDIASTTNAGIGLLLSFKKKADEKTFLNFEAYYKAKDLFDDKEMNTSFWKRNEIGLRFSFPLVPNNFRKS